MNEFTLSAGPLAFGDGTHPTTRGVLEMLGSIDPAQFAPQQALDMGAGSGILSAAIAAQFHCPVLAVDVAPSAVTAIVENAARNRLEGIHALRADGFDHPSIIGPYDLITMNILAEPLLRLAHAAAARLAPEGLLILSGLLQWQEPQIVTAYEELGLELTTRVSIGEWVTLGWQKPE